MFLICRTRQETMNFCSSKGIVIRYQMFAGLLVNLKVLVAQSVLELPPIVTHRGHPLTFCHPCVTAGLPATAGAKASSDSNLPSSPGVRIILELRCAFQVLNITSDGKQREQTIHHEPMVATRTVGPCTSPNVQRGGALCIQVCEGVWGNASLFVSIFSGLFSS